MTALALAALAVYAMTLCRTVFWYDSAEYVAAAYTLGIPHPPGYPLYTLIGHVFTWLPIDPALALNTMSAVFAALAVGLAYALLRAIGSRRFGATVGASTLAMSELFWSQALIAEVYAPAITFLLAVTLFVAIGLRDNRPGLVLLGAGLAGLGLGVHLSIATAGIGLAFMVAGIGLPISEPADLRRIASLNELGRRARIAALALVAAILGSCIFLYLPLRARMKPELNFGDPSNWERFRWHITGGNYKSWFADNLDPIDRLLEIGGILGDQLLVVGSILAVIGLFRALLRHPLMGAGLLLMAVGNLYFFFDYQVHDIEVFFLTTVAVLCIFVGLGAEAVLEIVLSLVRSEKARTIGIALQVLLLSFPLSLLLGNYRGVDMSDYTEAADYAETLIEDLPEGAVILNYTTPPEWKHDAVFGFYVQKVLGERLDVEVRSTVPLPGVLALLSRGVPVYLYYPVPQVVARLVIAEEGPIYRVHGLRERPQPPPRP